MSTSPILLQVDKLKAGYHSVPVIHDLSFTLEEGEMLIVLGTNGAGKSTLLRTLIGLLRPDTGRVILNGQDITLFSPEKRTRLGISYVPEGRRLFPGMTVKENLQVANHDNYQERCHQLENVLIVFPQLAERLHQRAWTLSGGEQQMLAIGRALMSHPRLLILDDPTLGLGPSMITSVIKLITEVIRHGRSIIIAMDNLAPMGHMVTKTIVLNRGYQIFYGLTSHLSLSLLHQVSFGVTPDGEKES